MPVSRAGEGATIPDAMGRITPNGHRIAPADATDPALTAAVLALWDREAGLLPGEGERRLGELLLVGTSETGEVAGVTTAFVRHDARLRAELWNVRVFVARAHRRGDLARQLAVAGRDALAERFAVGADTRGAGILYEVENPVLKAITEAVWPATRFVFVGETPGGAHIRVRWFDGARLELDPVPAPAEAAPDRPAGVAVVRNRLNARLADRVARFWTAEAGLDPARAQRRLDEVVCAVEDAGGAIAGLSTVLAADVPWIGGRRLWVYRDVLRRDVAASRPLLMSRTFAALDAEFDPDEPGPGGMFVTLSPAQAAQRPEAVWTDPPLVHAGVRHDGSHARVGWFDGAAIA